MRESCRMPFGGEIIEGIIVTRNHQKSVFFLNLQPKPITEANNYPLAIQLNVIEYGWGNGNFLSVYK